VTAQQADDGGDALANAVGAEQRQSGGGEQARRGPAQRRDALGQQPHAKPCQRKQQQRADPSYTPSGTSFCAMGYPIAGCRCCRRA